MTFKASITHSNCVVVDEGVDDNVDDDVDDDVDNNYIQQGICTFL